MHPIIGLPALHRIHLRTGACRVDDTWERVSYVEGSVPGLPLPEWASADQVLIDVARFLCSYHEAVRSFPQNGTDRWMSTCPKGFEGKTICHRDVSPSNMVFRKGIPCALIDFEYTGPAHFLWDVVLAARHWVPLKDPKDLDPNLLGVNLVERFGHFCDAYGLDGKEREKVVEGALMSLDLALQLVREQVKRENVLYMALWIRDYEGVNRRSCSWLERNREVLIGVL